MLLSSTDLLRVIQDGFLCVPLYNCHVRQRKIPVTSHPMRAQILLLALFRMIAAVYCTAGGHVLQREELHQQHRLRAAERPCPCLQEDFVLPALSPDTRCLWMYIQY